jgi:hypothetical protein
MASTDYEENVMPRGRVTEYNGIKFRSKFESEVAKYLDEHGMGYRFEHSIVTFVQPAVTRKYIPDFELANGIIVEAKGRWTVHDRKKIVLVREQNPKLDLRMLFQRDHFLNKGSKTRYSAWCEKRGIPYAIGTIPIEWLEEGKQISVSCEP